MANHKSASKAHKQSLARKARNTSIISKIKTFIKKVEEAITAGNKDEAKKAMVAAESAIMKGVTKKVLKKNTASRKVSRLSKKVKASNSKK